MGTALSQLSNPSRGGEVASVKTIGNLLHSEWLLFILMSKLVFIQNQSMETAYKFPFRKNFNQLPAQTGDL